MRILHLTEHYLPVRGGVETVVHEVSKRLVQNGHNVTVVCELEKGTPRREVVDGVQIHRVFGIRWARLKYDIGRVAPEMLLEPEIVKADILHCHNYGHFPLWVACFTRRPTVITTHSDPTTKVHPFWDMFRTIPLKFCDAVTTVTEMERTSLIKRGVLAEKIKLIPNGVNLPPIKAVYNDLGNSILCLARLDMWTKGQDILIKAMPTVISHIPDAVLYIAGTGKDFGKLQKITEDLGIQDNVKFLGKVDDQTKAFYLQNASVFCLPSRIEAFGIVYLEAMAYGRPIVAADTGGVPEVVNGCGIVVKENTPLLIGQALTELLTNKKKSAILGNRGLQRIKSYNWDSITTMYEGLYQFLINNKRTP